MALIASLLGLPFTSEEPPDTELYAGREESVLSVDRNGKILTYMGYEGEEGSELPRNPHPEAELGKTLPTTILGPLFQPDELDYYTGLGGLLGEETFFIYHGVDITIPINHAEYWRDERALIVVTRHGDRYEIGPRLLWRLHRAIGKKDGLLIMKTANRQIIASFWVPLFHEPRDPVPDHSAKGFRQRYVSDPNEKIIVDCVLYDQLTEEQRRGCDFYAEKD